MFLRGWRTGAFILVRAHGESEVNAREFTQRAEQYGILDFPDTDISRPCDAVGE
jgi:hypothetical protein